ncbi:RTA1 like protein-domain-containing protein [Rhexocercosporidium sp. MPI-PUGE-AT-0058]|nr:RTA1 like protein-domain-containing protein [Rhexocercosporidium sp. MPI-PUGE-AT-0058]
MAKLEAYKGVYYFWSFLPSQPASITFLFLFLITTVLHWWRIYKLRTWFCASFAIGCLSEVIGFAGRAVAYNKSADMGAYLVQAIFLVIAPAFFAASIYMTLSRIIRTVKGEHLSIIRINWLTRTFVIGDLISLNVQSGASGLNSTPKLAQIGEYIVVAGLFMQLILLGFFFVVAIIFQKRLAQQPTQESYTTEKPWRQTLYMIYVASAFIFGRSVFRVVEYMQGHDGYSLTHEWTLYTFDAVPMFIVTIMFWYWYPGYVQPDVEDIERIELANSGSKLSRFRWSQ